MKQLFYCGRIYVLITSALYLLVLLTSVFIYPSQINENATADSNERKMSKTFLVVNIPSLIIMCILIFITRNPVLKVIFILPVFSNYLINGVEGIDGYISTIENRVVFIRWENLVNIVALGLILVQVIIRFSINKNIQQVCNNLLGVNLKHDLILYLLMIVYYFLCSFVLVLPLSFAGIITSVLINLAPTSDFFGKSIIKKKLDLIRNEIYSWTKAGLVKKAVECKKTRIIKGILILICLMIDIASCIGTYLLLFVWQFGNALAYLIYQLRNFVHAIADRILKITHFNILLFIIEISVASSAIIIEVIARENSLFTDPGMDTTEFLSSVIIIPIVLDRLSALRAD